MRSIRSRRARSGQEAIDAAIREFLETGSRGVAEHCAWPGASVIDREERTRARAPAPAVILVDDSSIELLLAETDWRRPHG